MKDLFKDIILYVLDCFVIFDCFALPVQGTETRVNAGAEANEYIGQFSIDCDEVNNIYIQCFSECI